MKVWPNSFPVRNSVQREVFPGSLRKLKAWSAKGTLYTTIKRSIKPKDRKHLLNLKHLVKYKIKQAYGRYLENILGIQSLDQNVSSTPETGQSKFSVKKLFSFLKNSLRDAQGIGPISDHLPIHTYMPLLSLWDKISQNLAHLEANSHKIF